MKRTTTMVLAAAALAAAACGETEVDDEFTESDVTVEQPEPAIPGGEAAPGAAGAMIGVDTLQGTGAYITDGAGRALYLLEGEPADSSTCFDACAEEWPPFIAQAGTPGAGAAPVQAGLIGTIQRRDGRTQVTYGGHPLYYYHEDEGAGEATGQDVTDQWGEWYLVTPAGNHLEQAGP